MVIVLLVRKPLTPVSGFVNTFLHLVGFLVTWSLPNWVYWVPTKRDLNFPSSNIIA